MQNDDPYHDQPARFVGKRVTFDHAGKRLVGLIEAQVYAGRTVRGAIPDYRLTVRGDSGRTLEISLVESYASVEF